MRTRSLYVASFFSYCYYANFCFDVNVAFYEKLVPITRRIGTSLEPAAETIVRKRVGESREWALLGTGGYMLVCPSITNGLHMFFRHCNLLGLWWQPVYFNLIHYSSAILKQLQRSLLLFRIGVARPIKQFSCPSHASKKLVCLIPK